MSEIASWIEKGRPFRHYADESTLLFSVYNARLYHYFVLARDKKDALTILERAGHVITRNRARIKLADKADWAPDMAKFFAASAQAATKQAQGIVENVNGFAQMKNSGQIFMPLSVVSQ